MTGGVTLSRSGLRRPWRRRRGPTTPRAFDLSSPFVVRDEFRYLEELRQQGPVHWLPSHDAWLVLSYADADAVLASPDRFGQNPAYTADGQVMSGADPGAHAAGRRLLGARLGPEGLARILDDAEEHAGRLLRQGRTDRPFDVVEAFARPLADRVASLLLGVDPPMAGSATATWLRGDASVTAELRAARGLSDAQARSLVREFWSAATLTIGMALPSAILLVLQHPELQARLRSNDELLLRFVHEVLRLHPPARTLTRVALADGELGGARIRAGSTVIVSISAANRDPARFEAPAQVRLDRSPRHLAYGAGPHRCPGVALGRRTMAIGVRSLLGAGPGLHAAQDLRSVRWLDTGTVTWLHGPEHLWVTWD
jgi:cytochrome P450